MYLIGIDAGTTLAKAGVYDADGNAVALAERKAPEDIPQNGVYSQSGEEFFSIVLDLIKDAVGKAGVSVKSVEAIGFSGQMGGAIGVDENWEPVTDWSNALDSRYVPYTTKMLAQCRDVILQSSGTNYPFFAPKILWWRDEYPELFKKTSKFLILANYIAGRMSDLPIDSAFMDQTYLQMTGIADIPNQQWNADICEEFDIDADKLPSIINSTDVVGRLNKEAAEYCGLPSGIPLVAGAGDKPAGYLAAGMVEPGAMIDEAGSFSAFSLCTDRFVPDAEHRTLEIFPSAIAGLYYPTMILIGSGTAHRWVTDLLSSSRGTTDLRRLGLFETGSPGLPDIGC